VQRLFVFALAAATIAWPQTRTVAPGWTGPDTSDYQAGIDRKVFRSGRASLTIKAAHAQAPNYAVRQFIRADEYRGKRIRLTGYVRPGDAEQSALWLRVDMDNGDYILDGMLGLTPQDGKRAKGGWVQVMLVTDVPKDAIGIAYGARMSGKGQMWVDDLSLGVVDKGIMTNSIERRPYAGAGAKVGIQRSREEYAAAPPQPSNLDFERQ
jgi:hypothetical protein